MWKYCRFTNIWDWCIRDLCIDMVIVHVINDENSHPSWTNLHRNFWNTQERELPENSKFIQYHSEVDMSTIQGEILNAKPIGSTNPSLTRSTLSNGQRMKWTKAKVFVYSDSILCLGEFQIIQKQIEDGKATWQNFDWVFLMENCWELMVIEFEENVFLPHCRFLRRSRMIYKNETPNPNLRRSNYHHVKIQWYWMDKKRWEENCISNSEKKSKHVRKGSRQGLEHCSVLEGKRSGVDPFLTHPKENGTLHPPKMVERFKDTGHPVLKSASASSRTSMRKRDHTLQCGCFKHRASMSNYSLSESAQYPRSSHSVKSSVEGQTRKKRIQTSPHQIRTNRFWRVCIHKKWTL